MRSEQPGECHLSLSLSLSLSTRLTFSTFPCTMLLASSPSARLSSMSTLGESVDMSTRDSLVLRANRGVLCWTEGTKDNPRYKIPAMTNDRMESIPSMWPGRTTSAGAQERCGLQR